MSALPPKADINLCQAVFEKTKAKLVRRSGKLAHRPTHAPDPVLKTKAALIALICAVVLAQKDIKYLIATDPVPNAIIPLWAVMAYLIVVFMPASLLHRGWNK